jgi:hypothetical protein
MPTAEQCRAYAGEYHHLGQEADVSIQRALGLWNWLEERVSKKRTSTPMEIQPVSGPRPDAIPMGSSPSKPKRSSRPPQSAGSQANAETSRRSSLRNQRSQMEAIRIKGLDSGLGQRSAHTRWQKAGRGLDHFRKEGAKLVPEPTADDPYEDEAYRLWAIKQRSK